MTVDRGPVGTGTSLKSGRTEEGKKVNCVREWYTKGESKCAGLFLLPAPPIPGQL